MKQASLSYCLMLIFGIVFLFQYAAARDLKEQIQGRNPTEIIDEQRRFEEKAREILSRRNPIFAKPNTSTPTNKLIETNEKCQNTNSKCSDLAHSIETHFDAVEKNVELLEKIDKNLQSLLMTLANWKEFCGENENEQNSANGHTVINSKLVTLKPLQSDGDDDTPIEETTTTQKSTTTTPSNTNNKTSLNDSKADDPEILYRTFVGKDNEMATITCDPKKNLVITITGAYYGVSDFTKCPSTRHEQVPSKRGDRTDQVRGLCGTSVKSRCSFSINAASLDDSCPGVAKRLRVNYYCSAPGILGMNSR